MNQPNIALEKKLNVVAWIVTVVVLLLVGMMRRVKIPLPEGWDFSFLPPLHAGLNALAALFLIVAFFQIKNKNIEGHRKAIYGAVVCSVLFLLSYVAYHFTTPETLFGDMNSDGIVDASELAAVGTARTIYLFILFSHIVLAAVSFPFILFTFIRAYTNQFAKHKKMAKYVWPVWLYVAITGPVVYLMLMPYY